MAIITDSQRDHEFMGAAIACAQRAGEAGDVPVGAIIVLPSSLVQDARQLVSGEDKQDEQGEEQRDEGDEIIVEGFNRRQASGDPTSHAEIEALRAASRLIGNWRIEGTLYVTQEPCPMCAGALVNARITRLVYGCANPKAGAVDSLFQIVTDSRLNHRMPVTQGVRAQECAQLLRSFFAKLRQNSNA